LMPTVRILGTHGVPGCLGGFEEAGENVGKFLAGRGWEVVVYCQAEGSGPVTQDTWEGLQRVHIPVDLPGWRGTSMFDLLSVRHSSRYRDVCLVFGYNTGIFNTWQRLLRIPLVINMDGIEWSRARWGLFRQAILYVNERISALVGNRLIADHPEIEVYLRTRAPARKITMITYGADEVLSAPSEPVRQLGLEPGRYLTLVCRPIPENSILELVKGFSARPREHKLVVVGPYDRSDPYQAEVLAAASDQVVFPGAIYDPDRLKALRFHSALYLHGHTVGGTNPSLVEAMAAGNAVMAHDNPYNRWVAANGAVYFRTGEDVARLLDEVLPDSARLARMGMASRTRFRSDFTWERIAGQYEELLKQVLSDFERRPMEKTRMKA